jgi:hypothetical protein
MIPAPQKRKKEKRTRSGSIHKSLQRQMFLKLNYKYVLLLTNGLRKCGIYTQWNFSAMKKNEILLFANKWMELENIILSIVSQAQKAKNCIFSLVCGL